MRTWFDVPLFLYAIALGLGALFTVFHRLPWMLVIPPVILGFGGGLAIASVYSPTVAATLSSGFGYFVPNKVFETIAEAQPPDFSLAMLSFGMVTSWLSLGGIALMAVQFARRPRPDYLFALAWSVAAIYMAMSAVRFIFNASPAFAITSAWVTVLVVERLGFTEVRRAVAGTGGSRWTALRKGVKLRHIAGAFFVAALVMIPNAWSGVDAGVPFEKKRDLDVEVYRTLPEFLRPEGYREGLDLFYFGAFGYSLPLRTRYYPRAWEWLQGQDSDVFPLSSRPAFLSWWDYGFEAIQEGRHPAVADNFQNGFEYAGHFLLAQSENEGLAVLNARLLHGEVVPGRLEFTPNVVQALENRGLDSLLIWDVIRRPAVYIPIIRSDPDRFGEWHARISARNARVIYLKAILTEQLDLNGQAALYYDLTRATGNIVQYFAVDSRLVPFSGTNTGIFYAPAKLTDHKTAELPDLRSIPTDFYRLVAETDQGEFDLDKVPPTAGVRNVRIVYLEPFYNTLLYRIFFGIRGSDIGLENDGLPGFSGPLADEEPRHGWMMKHFRVVYRTAYFNPFPQDEAREHPEAWEAVNFFDALEFQDQIQRGLMEGTVDLGASGNLVQGVVILKYYDGARMRGRVLSETGATLEGVRLTVLDELGVPHDFVKTDTDGSFDVTLPFGQTSVVASVGVVDNRTHVGIQVVGEKIFNVSEEQAAGGSVDSDGDGRPDNLLEEDFVVKTGTMIGTAFQDKNGNAVRDPAEGGVAGLKVELRDLEENVVANALTGSDGGYDLVNLLPGDYTVRLLRDDTQLTESDVTLRLGQVRDIDLAIPVSRIIGKVTNEFGEVAAGSHLELFEAPAGVTLETTADGDGDYSFEGLLEGSFILNASLDGRGTIPQKVKVPLGVDVTVNVTLRPMGEIHGRTLLDFRPTPHVTINLHSPRKAPTISFTSDATGRFNLKLPEGTYSAYSLHFDQGRAHALLEPLTVREGADLQWQVNLVPAVEVTGVTRSEDGTPAEGAQVTFEGQGAPFTATTDPEGGFLVYLPPGPYRVWSLFGSAQHTSSYVLNQATTLEIELTSATLAAGKIFYDLNGNGTWDLGEGLEGVRIDLTDSAGNRFAAFSELEGDYQIPLLEALEYTPSTSRRTASIRFLWAPLSPQTLRRSEIFSYLRGL